MPWQNWLEITIIRAVVRHCSGTAVSIVLFWLIGLLLKYFQSDPTSTARIEKIENFVLEALFVILAIQLGLVLIKEVWKQIREGWSGGQILAI